MVSTYSATIKLIVCLSIIFGMIGFARPRSAEEPVLITDATPMVCSDDGGAGKTGGRLDALFNRAGNSFLQKQAPHPETIKVPIKFLREKLKIIDPRSMGVLLEVKDKDVLLKALTLEVYSGDKKVFASDLN